MSKMSEMELRIQGTIDGVEITPETTPLARLAEYLTDLAAIMGYKESVHLIRVEEGSTRPVILVHSDDEPRVTLRLQQAQLGRSTREANLAYKRFDDRLREDNAVAEVVSNSRSSRIIEFPGRVSPSHMEYVPVREAGELVGEVRRVGGLDETVPIWLRRADQEIFYCEASEQIARALGPFIYKTIRVFGIGKWVRNRDGKWKLEKFHIRSFDPKPLSDATFAETLGSLRALPGADWGASPDPLADLQSSREWGGTDEDRR